MILLTETSQLLFKDFIQISDFYLPESPKNVDENIKTKYMTKIFTLEHENNL